MNNQVEGNTQSRNSPPQTSRGEGNMQHTSGVIQPAGTPQSELSQSLAAPLNSNENPSNTQVAIPSRSYEQKAPALPQMAPRRVENQAHQPPPPQHPPAPVHPPDPYEDEYREFMDNLASRYTINEITKGNIISPVLAMAIGAKTAEIAATPSALFLAMAIVPFATMGVNITSRLLLKQFRESAGAALVKMNSFSNRGFFLFRLMDKIINPLSRRLTNNLILGDTEVDQLLRYSRDQNSRAQLTSLHPARVEHLLDIATHAHVLVKTVENRSPTEGVNFGDYQMQFNRYREAAAMAAGLYSQLVRRRQNDRDWYRARIRREIPENVNRLDRKLWMKFALLAEPIGNLWPAALAYATIQIISGKAIAAAQSLAKDIGEGAGKLGGEASELIGKIGTQINNIWTTQIVPWFEGLKDAIFGSSSANAAIVASETSKNVPTVEAVMTNMNAQAALTARDASAGVMTMANSSGINAQDIAHFVSK